MLRSGADQGETVNDVPGLGVKDGTTVKEVIDLIVASRR
jgi:hypothetical protein